MNFEKPSQGLTDLFTQVAPTDDDVVHKTMFSYPACFANGNLFASLHAHNIVVRLGPEERAELLKVEGAHLFEPMPGRAMKEYVVVPASIMADEIGLRQWLATSLEYARSLPAKVKKPKKEKGK